MINIRTLISKKSNIKMALIVRADLKLTKGKIASQVSHASIICYQKSMINNSNILKQWLLIGQPKIVVKVNDLEHLNLVYEHARKLNIVSEFVCDAGRTQIEEGTITVLGIGPDISEKINLVTEKLKLL